MELAASLTENEHVVMLHRLPESCGETAGEGEQADGAVPGAVHDGPECVPAVV